MIECSYKDCSVNEKNETKGNKLNLHHLILKLMGGTDGDGRRWICKKHHDILHFKLAGVIWRYVPDDKKEECKKAVKSFSLRFIGEE